MTTRRALLRLAGLSVLGSCTPTAPDKADRTHLIFLTTKDGVSVFDQLGRVITAPTAVAVATPSWSHAVTTSPRGANTRVVVLDLVTMQVISANTLQDRLEPRIVTAAGDLIASVTPGGAGIYGLHQAGGRERTTIVVSGPSGEHTRLDLPGNLEPEAFSSNGDLLFVLEYLPAAKPERFRVRTIDLARRQLTPVGTQMEMRAHRIETVQDARRAMLFTLYSYESAGIAFVHYLDLRRGLDHHIELPAPFGRERPGVNAIALSPTGDRLCVVHAPSATVVDIDPDLLVVKKVSKFAETGQLGKPNVQITASGRLIVNVDRMVIATDPRLAIATPGEARGLALDADGGVWAGHPNGVVHYDLATGKEIGRVSVPDLFVVKHVR